MLPQFGRRGLQKLTSDIVRVYDVLCAWPAAYGVKFIHTKR